MLACLEFAIKVITNYMWRWAQGKVKGIRYLLRVKNQTWKCRRLGVFMMGVTAVQSEPSGWELSIVDDRKRYFMDSHQLVFFQRQRKKKITLIWQSQVTTHTDKVLSGTRESDWSTSFWFCCLQLVMLKTVCILKHIHTYIYANTVDYSWQLSESYQSPDKMKPV